MDQKNVWEQVIQFNRDIIGVQPDGMALLNNDELNFTVKALREEVEELREAHGHGDFIGCVDALMDSIYFAIGGLYKLGLSADQMEKCMTVIHEANMAKRKGVTDRGHSNDAIKPEGWVSPEEKIADILDQAE